jgi:hypothetical protein
MIRTVSELLRHFVDAERKVLDRERVTHGPTIGAMYEGLTRNVLERSIPQELGLRVTEGFVFFRDTQSGQIDSMLVRGEGEPIPYTDSFRWHVKDVLAVFEVKKSLTAADLADSYEHLRVISQLYSEYIESEEAKDDKFDLSWPRRVFAQMTGVAPPRHAEVAKLPESLEYVYHTLVMEYLSPVRIVVGHHGWKRESTLRRHIIRMAQDRLTNPVGMGVGSFPQLIVSGSFALVKANGFPYAPAFINGNWPFLLSTSHNPIRVMLELLFTKLDSVFATNLTHDDSLEQEAMTPCLWGRIVKQADRLGWEYRYDNVSSADLVQRGASYTWKPAELTVGQYVVIGELCKRGVVSLRDSAFLEFAAKEPGGVEAFIRSLIQTQLVCSNGSELTLTTEKCSLFITPDGKYVAGENNAGQMFVWMESLLGKPLGKMRTLVVIPESEENSQPPDASKRT